MAPDESGRTLSIALAGNPNVGKSTVFNALTGMHQHTGNWPGKTVALASGSFRSRGRPCRITDLPGTYSLMSRSEEETVARDFILFGGADCTVIVCDASCLERGLNLFLQTAQLTENIVLCVNLIDEADKKHIRVDFQRLERELGVPVIPVCARERRGLTKLIDAVAGMPKYRQTHHCLRVRYPKLIEDAAAMLVPAVERESGGRGDARFLALKLLEGDPDLAESMEEHLHLDLSAHLKQEVERARQYLRDRFIDDDRLRDILTQTTVRAASEIAGRCVEIPRDWDRRDRRLDRILTGRFTGTLCMLLLLGIVFFITITGANYPSGWLMDGFSALGTALRGALEAIHTPDWIVMPLMDGVYLTLTWVVSVMLPPMAIFFPIFTLLEDSGYLPRIAFNLDSKFKHAGACGKQALTLCMGFGCNAAGVTGCRIIDSPRERMIAVLTNAFVPCNGRFPFLITMISAFLTGTLAFPLNAAASSLILVCTILLGIGMTLLVSRLLSGTLLRGVPSSFTLELPPYRRPQIGRVIVRSVLDRTVFVLGRAAAVAAPAGLVLWLCANVRFGGSSIFEWLSGLLDPIAAWFGVDGVIFAAFLFGLPANEIVLPIMMMGYLSTGTMVEAGSLVQMSALFTGNGWTVLTAVNVMILCLFHSPCATTLWTVKKETGSLKWALLSAALPAACGLLLCFVITQLTRMIGAL
ncbi:MAG TPA: ferrous iron transport protein B [Candidatus Onthovicinus excrementipullorum]|nr:ferrous iron transport protein B [Candidatus Onthovicinus excrementipullorum]